MYTWRTRKHDFDKQMYKVLVSGCWLDERIRVRVAYLESHVLVTVFEVYVGVEDGICTKESTCTEDLAPG